ncbi:MAG: UDP-N-acetylglucosamine 2-epimerase (non-hydrolyzing) [Bacteroidota bacterium]
MLKIITIIGARPQIIKAAAISRCIRNSYADRIQEIIVHTGQHYDDNMSDVFFREMEIPAPDYNLNVGSASHAVQTALMMQRIEETLLREKPGLVLIYGDTNSTLAGSVTAAKLNIPVAHVEAGLRSFNRRMPEEINRTVCDHLSALLFSPTETGVKNLFSEGIGKNTKPPYNAENPGVFNYGDVMYDNALFYSEKAKTSKILKTLDVQENKYFLCTIHRDHNTDVPENLNSIFRAILKVSENTGLKAVIPLHPRTSGILEKTLKTNVHCSLNKNPLISIIPPVSFFEMMMLEKNAKLIMTDSGGVQKEAYFYKKPCIILRPETEWVELVETGAAVIANCDEAKITEAAAAYLNLKPSSFPEIFGNGRAAEYICSVIIKTIKRLECC